MTHGSNQPSFTDNLLKPSNLTMFDTVPFPLQLPLWLVQLTTLSRGRGPFPSLPGLPGLSGPPQLCRGLFGAMIRASSEHMGEAPRRGASMRGSLSRASLASSGLFTGTLMSRHSRSASLSPTPKSTNHGRWDAGGEWYFLHLFACPFWCCPVKGLTLQGVLLHAMCPQPRKSWQRTAIS